MELKLYLNNADEVVIASRALKEIAELRDSKRQQQFDDLYTEIAQELKAEQESIPSTPPTVEPKPVPVIDTPLPAPAAAAEAKTATEAEAIDAFRSALARRVELPAVVALLREFGAARVTELPAENRGAFVERIGALSSGDAK